MVYLIGALKDSDDEDILTQEQSAPIMRFDLSNQAWEVFSEEKAKRLNFNDFIKNSQTYVQDEDNKITYRDILYPGTFMIGSRVYMVNGQKMSKRGILETLTRVYSIDLDEDGFDFREEDIDLPIQVFRPICGSYKKTAFITGGVVRTSKHSSKHSFMIKFRHDPPKVEEIHGLKVDLDDNYPVIGTSHAFYCISYPYVAIYDRRNKNWKQYALEKSFINRRDTKYETPILNSEVVQGADHIRHSIKYNTLEKNVKIVDDVPEGESLSQIDISMKVELPPGIIIENTKKTKKKNSDSSSSGESSEQFSSERVVELPKAVMKGMEDSSISKENSSKKPSKSSDSSFSRESESSSLYFVRAEGIPDFKAEEIKASKESKESSMSSIKAPVPQKIQQKPDISVTFSKNSSSSSSSSSSSRSSSSSQSLQKASSKSSSVLQQKPAKNAPNMKVPGKDFRPLNLEHNPSSSQSSESDSSSSSSN
jgi:hypothetical protein